MIRYLYEKVATVYVIAVWTLPYYGPLAIAQIVPRNIGESVGFLFVVVSMLACFAARTKAPFIGEDFS